MARVSFALPGTGLAFRVKAGRGRNGNLSLENVICPHCNQMLPEDRREGDCPVCGNPLAGYAPVVAGWTAWLGRFKVNGWGLAGIVLLPAVLTFLMIIIGGFFPLCGRLVFFIPLTLLGGSLLAGLSAGLIMTNWRARSVPAGTGSFFRWGAALTGFSLLLCLCGFLAALGLTVGLAGAF